MPAQQRHNADAEMSAMCIGHGRDGRAACRNGESKGCGRVTKAERWARLRESPCQPCSQHCPCCPHCTARSAQVSIGRRNTVQSAGAEQVGRVQRAQPRRMEARAMLLRARRQVGSRLGHSPLLQSS